MNSALLFDFADINSAALAFDTLEQLGYDPVLHEGGKLHIHMVGNDLISALEIMQMHGGRLIQESAIDANAYTDTAYSLDSIAIPAHIVNEDWNEEL
ncbi:hypothetical protein SAMN04487969_108176 [Paenibacillus algorifonticola]|uniref:Uncharacterized protein n=1 Tax=Paenibacillus algorifonticola TaxID=684063 RepID=A0A1I2E4E1_9BACL